AVREAAVSATGGGWRGSLHLELERRNGATLIARRRHVGPMLVQRAFHEPDGSCQIYLIHPPGGVVGGDELTLDVLCGAETRALITTPAATKLYRSAARSARLVQRFRVHSGAHFEWLPQETIAYTGSHTRAETLVELDATAHFAGWEVLCL